MSQRRPAAPARAEAPIELDVIEGNAYVWTVPAVRRLRERHRLVGAMAGGLAGYKSQVAVRGLPLRLSREEASLALGRGWAVVAPVPASTARLAAAGARPAAGKAVATAVGSKRPREESHACAQQGGCGGGGYEDDEDAYADYYASYYGDGEEGKGVAAAKEEDGGGDSGDDDEDDNSAGPRPWTDAVANGDHMDLPTTAAEADALNARGGNGVQKEREEAVAAADASSLPAWTFPSTPYERLRAAVFADLHDQGFTLTDGAKFGGDYLAYPGDPFVYHAQFVVRVLPPSVGPAAQQAAGGIGDAPPPPPSPSLLPPGAIRPTLLKAWARGVHGARKHLLLATAADARELLQASPPRLRYLTIAKESGFVSSAADKGPEGGEGTAGEAAAPAGGGGRGGGRGGRGGRHQQRGRGRGGRGSFARGRGGRGRDRGR